MRSSVLAACAALAVALGAFAAPLPARANVFCPVTIDAMVNLASLGRGNTYGVLLHFDPSDVGSVRMRVDTARSRFAVDFNDLETVGSLPLRAKYYFALPAGERLQTAWVESTGAGADQRTECPVTRPFGVDAPPPLNDRAQRTIDADKRTLRDSFSTRTPIVQPRAFGAAEQRSCAQPYEAARALLPLKPEAPPAARAVHATGTVVVRVDLDEASNVVAGDIVRSSGFAPLDRVALAAAMKSTYKTETFACRPVASSYELTVAFQAG